MENKQIRVAITGVGSGIGQSIVRSCRMSSISLYLIGLDSNVFAYGAYDCHEYYQVSLSTLSEYPDQLLKICLDNGVNILIPGLDQDLLILSEHESRFTQQGVHVLVGGVDFLKLCRDKRLWSKSLNKICPNILPGFTPQEALHAISINQIAFPLIAKPNNGSASDDIRIILSNKDLDLLSIHHVVQPYAFPKQDDISSNAITKAIKERRLLQKSEVSLQWVVSKSGEIITKTATQNNLKGGVPIEIIPIDEQPYSDVLMTIVPFLVQKGMKGPVNIQGRMTSEGPRFFEMNGRFTGITGLRAMLGFNEVELAIRDFMDLPLPDKLLTLNSRRIGIRQVTERIVSIVEHKDVRNIVERQTSVVQNVTTQRILVTGATGWLGRHLVDSLLTTNSKNEIIALVRSKPHALSIWSEPNVRLHFWECNFPNIGDSRFADVDVVIHLASQRDVNDNIGQSESLFLTRQLVHAAARFHIPRFVYLSSQSVYGFHHSPPWKETLIPGVDNLYGMQKWAGEQIVSALGEFSPSTNYVSVRLSRLFGALQGLRWTELPHKFALDAVYGKVLNIRGGQQIFDLIHIRDAVRALLQLLGMPHGKWSPVYNIGCGKPVSIVTIAESAISASRRAGFHNSDLVIHSSEDRPLFFGMDTSLFHSHSGWIPMVSLDNAMDELIELAAKVI